MISHIGGLETLNYNPTGRFFILAAFSPTAFNHLIHLFAAPGRDVGNKPPRTGGHR